MSNLPRTYQEPVWTDDLDPNGRETSSDLESLEQDVMHVIGERLGSNSADPQKGAGALQMLNGSTANIEQLPHVIDAQLAQFTRITASQTTLTVEDDGSFFVAVTIAVAGQVVNFQYKVGPNGVQSAP